MMQNMLDEAKRRLGANDLAGAQQMCRTILESQAQQRHLGALQVLEEVSRRWVSGGQYDRVAECCELMLTKYPESADLYMNLGSALIRSG